jgi:hypothetical protein
MTYNAGQILLQNDVFGTYLVARNIQGTPEVAILPCFSKHQIQTFLLCKIVNNIIHNRDRHLRYYATSAAELRWPGKTKASGTSMMLWLLKPPVESP